MAVPETHDSSPALPEELARACAGARLTVLEADFDGDQAILMDAPPFMDADAVLLVARRFPRDRKLLTVRQSLADLGAPGFEDVAVEPFAGSEVAYARG